MKRALERLPVQLGSGLFGRFLQKMDERHVVGEDDYLSPFGLLT
jgi:hypothetical protein